MMLIQFGRTKGERSSGFLFLHWLLQVLAMAIVLYSNARLAIIAVSVLVIALYCSDCSECNRDITRALSIITVLKL